MSRKDPKVHTPFDGRGPRRVLLDGRVLDACFYANERKGKARVFLRPMRLDKYRKRALWRTVYGCVVVEPVECRAGQAAAGPSWPSPTDRKSVV